jgi:hypothetical protein
MPPPDLRGAPTDVGGNPTARESSARQWSRREVEAVIWDVLGRELPTLTLPQHLNIAKPRRGTPPHLVKLDEIARDLGVSARHIRRPRFDVSEVVAWLGTVRTPPGNEASLR